jgi:hypothetical protein
MKPAQHIEPEQLDHTSIQRPRRKLRDALPASKDAAGAKLEPSRDEVLEPVVPGEIRGTELATLLVLTPALGNERGVRLVWIEREAHFPCCGIKRRRDCTPIR